MIEIDIELYKTSPRYRADVGDKLAADHMLVAKKYARRATYLWPRSYEEALSDILQGLASAIVRYEPDKGPFSHYASRFMWGAVRRGIRSEIGKPEYPRPKINVTEDETLSVLLERLRPHEPTPHQRAEWSELWRYVDQLTPRNALIVKLRYRWDLSQHEIAGVVGLSQMQISRILASSHEMLADLYNTKEKDVEEAIVDSARVAGDGGLAVADRDGPWSWLGDAGRDEDRRRRKKRAASRHETHAADDVPRASRHQLSVAPLQRDGDWMQEHPWRRSAVVRRSRR